MPALFFKIVNFKSTWLFKILGIQYYKEIYSDVLLQSKHFPFSYQFLSHIGVWTTIEYGNDDFLPPSSVKLYFTQISRIVWRLPFVVQITFIAYIRSSHIPL